VLRSTAVVPDRGGTNGSGDAMNAPSTSRHELDLAFVAGSGPFIRRDEKPPRVRDESYAYLPAEENLLWPISVAGKFPVTREVFRPAWVAPLLPNLIAAGVNAVTKRSLLARTRPTTIAEAEQLHRRVFRGAVPSYVDRYEDDSHFGWNRIGGVNPTMIERVRSRAWLREKLPEITDEHLRRAVGGSRSLDQEIEEHRLFQLDYEILQAALRPRAKRCSRWRNKYLPAPVVLLVERPGFGRWSDLAPIAITIDQPDAPGENPMWIRDGSLGWKIAKYYVEVADHCHHMAIGHLGRGHLMMEPFALSARRCLAPEHPVRMLIEPHLTHTLMTNRTAYQYFVDRTKIYERFYSGDLEETRALAAIDRGRHGFRDLGLLPDLARRGVDDSLEVYPQRDDARLYLEPIETFVRGVLTDAYRDDVGIARDAELATFLRDLEHEERGNLWPLLDPSGTRLDAWIEAIARVIYIAGPGHAAHHFAEMHYCRYAPAYPGAAFAPPPRSEADATESQFLSMLPPIEVATEHHLFSDFGAHRWDCFGDYRGYPIESRPGASDHMARLSRSLREVEATIGHRNSGRSMPYDLLMPSRVPNAINF